MKYIQTFEGFLNESSLNEWRKPAVEDLVHNMKIKITKGRYAGSTGIIHDFQLTDSGDLVDDQIDILVDKPGKPKSYIGLDDILIESVKKTWINEDAAITLDLSNKEVAVSIKSKLATKYIKDTKLLVYNAAYAIVSHGAKLTNLPTPSRVFQLEKMKETYRGSDNWISLSSLAIVQDTTNQVTFVIVYEEFDPIQLDEIKSNTKLYKEEDYKDEKDLLKKIQTWFAYSEKVFKQVIEDSL